MTFHILQNSTTADANDENDNFYHIGQGSRLPMGGVSLTATDSVYDLGASSTAWNNLYCNNVYSTNGIISDNAGLWTKVYDEILASSTSRIEISGLDSEAYTGFFYDAPNSGGSTYLSFNNDSTASIYGYQYLSVQNASITSERVATSFGFVVSGVFSYATAPSSCFCKFTICAKTGNERTILLESLNQGIGNYVDSLTHLVGIWNDTSNTLTTIAFWRNGGSHLPGVHIVLFKKG